MNNKFNIFEPKFNDEKLEKDFTEFFYIHNLIPLFTNEHRANGISVTYIDAKSVINDGGSYHKTLTEFTTILNSAMDNKTYEEAVFKILHNTRSFQSLMNKIKKVIEHEKHKVREEHKFNLWNIVFYNKELL